MMKGRIFPLCPHGDIGHRRRFWTRATGEFRRPRAGEFFVSGAVPEAYLAFNDLDSEYHIVVFIPDPPPTVVVDGFRYRLEGAANERK